MNKKLTEATNVTVADPVDEKLKELRGRLLDVASCIFRKVVTTLEEVDAERRRFWIEGAIAEGVPPWTLQRRARNSRRRRKRRERRLAALARRRI